MNHKKLAMLFAGVGVAGLALAEAHDHFRDPPTQAEIDFASATSDLMTNTVIAALLQEINETTPANAANGIQSISLVFNDHNRDMRLVGTLQPFSRNDLPADRFESTALANAMQGTPTTSTEFDDGHWYYRRSIPLSNFAPQCQTCHPNFASLSSSDWVGALMLRIPIDNH